VRQFTRRDGLIEVEGDVYRKTNGEDGIRYVKAELLALPDIGEEPVEFVDKFLTRETRTVIPLRLPKWLTHAVALDIHSFYHCLKIPVAWRRKFGLPRIRGQLVLMVEEWVWAVNTTLPMG
jgi:hypothetical protein